jgi:hypothetical protein
MEEINLMSGLLDRFEWTTLPDFRMFVDQLDGLALRIRGRDSQWDRSFRNGWGALEEAYAEMVTQNMSAPGETLSQVIASGVAKLRATVRSKAAGG